MTAKLKGSALIPPACLLLALPLAALGCGKTTLDPVEGEGTGGTGAAGNGGSGGSAGNSSGASGGSAGNTAFGGSAGSSAAGGSAGNGGSDAGGNGGSGATTGCSTPNPAGCIQTGCEGGLVCDTTATACRSSSCSCDPGTDTWGCDADCGGGVCVPNTNGADYFVRVGYLQGQEATGEFCVAYQDDGLQPAWEKVGLMEQNGYSASDFEGLDKLSRYLPLAARPLYFGKAYTKCNEPFIEEVRVDSGSSYHTFLSVPYSGEADFAWVVADPTPDPNLRGVRIVNAGRQPNEIEVMASVGLATPAVVGIYPFGNSPSEFEIIPFGDHLHELWVKDLIDSTVPSVLSFVHFDLLPLYGTTIYVSGLPGSYAALGCWATNPDAPASRYADCFFTEEQSPVAEAPTISSVLPQVQLEGRDITIVGTNFTAQSEVTIRDVRASVVVVGATQLVATVPQFPEIPGNAVVAGSVVVNNPGIGSAVFSGTLSIVGAPES